MNSLAFACRCSAFAVSAVWLVSCASSRLPSPPPFVNPAHVHFEEAAAEWGKPAPDFTLPTLEGRQSLTLSQFRGKPVVLVFGSYT